MHKSGKITLIFPDLWKLSITPHKPITFDISNKRFYSSQFTNNSRIDLLLILNFFYPKNWTRINGQENGPKQYTSSIFHNVSKLDTKYSRAGIEGTLQQSVKIRSNSPKSLGETSNNCTVSITKIASSKIFFYDILQFPPYNRSLCDQRVLSNDPRNSFDVLNYHEIEAIFTSCPF